MAAASPSPTSAPRTPAANVGRAKVHKVVKEEEEEEEEADEEEV